MSEVLCPKCNSEMFLEITKDSYADDGAAWICCKCEYIDGDINE